LKFLLKINHLTETLAILVGMKNQSVAALPGIPLSSSIPRIEPLKVYGAIVDVVFAIDENGIFQFVSPSCLQLFGYSAEEMTGASFLNFIHPDDIEKTVQIVSERTHDCKTSNFQNRYYHKNGTLVPVIWSGRWDETDKLLYCVARDGSEKQAMEQRLHKAQQVAKVASYEFDVVNNCYTYTSDTIFDLFGLDQKIYSSFTPELFWRLIHPDDVALVRRNVLHPENLLSSTLEYRIIRPNGEVVYINRIREVICDKDGKAVKNIGMLQDITDRKIGELALQQREERFRSLVQYGSDLIGILDAQGTYLFVAENVQEQLGYRAGELLGKNALQFIHPDDIEMIATALQQLMREKTISVGPYRFQNGRGEWRWVETTASNHLDNPAIGGVVVNSRDVTEKKRRDDELRKLSLIAQESQTPMLITNLKNEITWANNAFFHLSGYSAAEVIGKRPEDIFVPEKEDAATLLKTRKDLMEGKVVRSENRYCSKTGKEYWLDLTIQPVFDENEEPVWLLAMGKDITDRKLAEQARLQAEERFRALVRQGSDVIVVMDEKGILSYISDNAAAVLGYTPAEMVGKNAFGFIHPADREKLEKEIFTLLQDGTNAKGVQHRFQHKNGNWLWLESRGTNYQDKEVVGGILLNVRNITERVRLQKRLHRELVNKQKEITAAVIKAQESERSQLALELHDNVNQILTTVKLYNEMYMTGHVQDKELLVKATQYTQDCINEIRSISKRLSAPLLGKIALHDSIQELVNSINLTRRVKIVYLPKNIRRCWVAEDLHLAVYRIVQEGLNNILKYSQATEAHLEMTLNDKELCVKISDNGKGFDTAAKREGIGITNMKTRAENMQANFQLRSAPGEGCEIRICFPIRSTNQTGWSASVQ
jgi:PAS domain S-box-containing protein